MAEQLTFPTKRQAIVLDSMEGISVQEYVIAIGKLTDPKNIRFVSRISHGRLCMYLNAKETADKLTDTMTLKMDVIEFLRLIRNYNREEMWRFLLEEDVIELLRTILNLDTEEIIILLLKIGYSFFIKWLYGRQTITSPDVNRTSINSNGTELY